MFCCAGQLLAQQEGTVEKYGKQIQPSAVTTQKEGSPVTENTQGKEKAPASLKDHIFRKPGEITFTVGAIIEGKIEKPQVIIVFPKEKPKSDSIVFDNSFKAEMLKPLNIEAFKAVNK